MSRRGVAAILLAGAALGATGCSTASDPSPPAGVDMLVIPTPTPDPDDFVDRIDNQWLPLKPGSEWSYELSGESHGSVTVIVADQTRTVAGIEATVVETVTARDGAIPIAHAEDFYAQDTAGNVWWFGREGAWEAGVDGAEAGLAMADTPRPGDGYWLALLDGVVEDRARVVSATEDLVEIEIQSPLIPGLRRLHSYAAGVGLVQIVTVEGPNVQMDLVSGP